MLARSLVFVALLAVGVAQADEQSNVVNQLAKRSYAAPVKDKEVLEGASVTEEIVVDKKHQPLRLHMLGKLPYMEKATD